MTSSVSSPGPPSTSTTPKEVNVKRKTRAAAAAIAGASAGSVTWRSVASVPAPSSRAASSARGSRLAQTPPTSRITIATL